MLVVRCLVSKRLRAIFPHSIKRGFKFQEIKLSKKSSDGPEQTSWSFRPIKDCRGPLPIVELDRWYWLALGRAETMRFGNLSIEFLRYAHRLKQLSSPVWSYGFNSTKRNKNSHIKLTQRVWERERERERESETQNPPKLPNFTFLQR